MCRTLHKHINCTTKKIFLELYPCRTIGSIIEFQPDLSENIITTAKLSSDLIYDSPSPHLKLFCKSLLSAVRIGLAWLLKWLSRHVLHQFLHPFIQIT